MESAARRRMTHQDPDHLMLPPTATVLIFDFDNTLIRSAIDFLGLRHRLIDELYAHALTELPREDLLKLSLAELVGLAHQQPTLSMAMWVIIRKAEVEGIRGAETVEFAGEVLEKLRVRGYRLALLTNNARDSVEERLVALDLSTHFDLVVTRSEGIALKPSPEGINYILQRLEGIETAYMIGDAYIDGAAAATAGIRFIGFGEKAADVTARGIAPWAWITDLRELLALAL